MKIFLLLFGLSSGQYYQMLSPGHLKNLQKAGLTTAKTQFFFNTRKTIFNMGSNEQALTSAEVAATHALYPNADMNYNLNSFGPNTLTGAPGIQGVFAANSTSIPEGLNSVSSIPRGRRTAHLAMRLWRWRLEIRRSLSKRLSWFARMG